MKKQLKKGFTLTELVIVIVIIAILAAVLIPSMTGYVNRAKKSNAQSEASSVYTVFAAWLADTAENYGAEDITATYDSSTPAKLTAISFDKKLYTVKDGTQITTAAIKDASNDNTEIAYTIGSDAEIAATKLTEAYAKLFAYYYATAQGTTADAKASSIEVGNLTFVSVSLTEFTIISSNNYYAKCSIASGSPVYTIGEKAGQAV